MIDKYEKFKKAYAFFKQKFDLSESFSIEELIQVTGWSISTVNTYKGKKWNRILKQTGRNNYIVVDFSKYDENSFVNFMSQKQEKSANPFQLNISQDVKLLIDKAYESCYLAVDIYNRPQTTFRSSGFIVLMIIAWTSLLQAYCKNEGIDYYKHNPDGSIVVKDGENVTKSINELLGLVSFLSEPEKENIRLLVKVRNKIEHHGNPIVDIDLLGYIQASLLNSIE